MSKYYDYEIIISQEATYMIRHKDASKNKVEEIRKQIEEDTVNRLKKAGATPGNVKVEIILHESAPQPEPVPCPLCGAKTEVEVFEQMKSADGNTTSWYSVSHSLPLVDASCPLALASKPFHHRHKTPLEAVENWNRWCSHEQT